MKGLGYYILALWCPGNVQVLVKILFALIYFIIGLISGTPKVTSINVNRIGRGGGTIVIEGEGFATDGFSQFDPTKGNKVGLKNLSNGFPIFILYILQVIFSNELLSVECQNPVNWNFLLENPQDPSPYKIACDLPPRPVSTVHKELFSHIT